MRSFISFIALATLPTFILASPTPRDYGLQKREPTVEGLDLWDIHGGAVDYSFWTALGIKYAYVQATKSSSLKNQYFEQQYSGAGTAGIFRGAWHYAFPSQSDGKTQAEFFLANGGAWNADGKTLPGVLYVDHTLDDPNLCFGVEPANLVAWIREFSDTYHSKTNRYPVICTSIQFWNWCVKDDPSFGATNPLWLSKYFPEIEQGAIPPGWTNYTFWDNITSFWHNGDLDSLTKLAAGQ